MPGAVVVRARDPLLDMVLAGSFGYTLGTDRRPAAAEIVTNGNSSNGHLNALSPKKGGAMGKSSCTIGP